jgi:hypothetical protein
MSLTITEHTQGIWFVELLNGDWMATIDALDGGRCRLTYRFRYNRDSKVWDSEDEKSWHQGEADDLAQGIECVREIIRQMKGKGAGKATELMRGNLSTRDYVQLLMHQTFVHAKEVSKEEWESMRREGKL